MVLQRRGSGDVAAAVRRGLVLASTRTSASAFKQRGQCSLYSFKVLSGSIENRCHIKKRPMLVRPSGRVGAHLSRETLICATMVSRACVRVLYVCKPG